MCIVLIVGGSSFLTMYRSQLKTFEAVGFSTLAREGYPMSVWLHHMKNLTGSINQHF